MKESRRVTGSGIVSGRRTGLIISERKAAVRQRHRVLNLAQLQRTDDSRPISANGGEAQGQVRPMPWMQRQETSSMKARASVEDKEQAKWMGERRSSGLAL